MEETNVNSTRKQKSKLKGVQSWEIDAVSEFLLWLFHNRVITIRDDFDVEKRILYKHFNQFLILPENSELKKKCDADTSVFNVLSLLSRTNFIHYKNQRPKYVRIKKIQLYQYSEKKRKRWEKERINNFTACGISSNQDKKEADTSNAGANNEVEHHTDPELADCFRIADDAESEVLIYQGTALQKRKSDFHLSNMGCYICQCNFDIAEKYEEHLEWHGDESDFESLKELKKRENPVINLSYKVCKDSHYFCFNLSTTEDHVLIEKIIIVQSRSVFYANNNRVPYEITKLENNVFFVDSHLFSIHVEQPVVVVFHYKSNEAFRIIEQHHFLRSEKFPEVNFSIKSNRLPNRPTFKHVFKLLEYFPPEIMVKVGKNQFAIEDLCKIDNEFRNYMDNNKKITFANADKILDILLQIDDIESIQELANIGQTNVKIRCVGSEYSVRLKNAKIFIENILSKYDDVLVSSTKNEKMPKSSRKKLYTGSVQKVIGNRVIFSCDKKLFEDEYDISFRPSRNMIRYQYRALRIFSGMSGCLRRKILFPNTENLQPILNNSSLSNLKLFNPNIAKNVEQLEAVIHITSGHLKDAPYIIFGPPGTGKTTTIVEAIAQLYTLCDSNKILVTAGSNTACDEVASRLCKILQKNNDNRCLIRIYSKSYDKNFDDIEDDLLEASNLYGAHFYPDVLTLNEYRIIVCTFGVIGKLALGNFGRIGANDSVFTHVFIDEAAAATLPEALIAITASVSLTNNLIISGDHKQLGPVVLSSRAKDLGLSVSIMDHLLELDCYKPDQFGKYNSALQARLKRNHRSHQKIVDLYSSLFYDNELMAFAKDGDINWGSKWHMIPNPDYPIMFHSVFGTCSKGSGSLSYYNDMELEVVMDYVKELLCFGVGGKKIEESDIGIISPYRNQYMRIREELNLRKIYAVETGSVEIFQGKEKQVIIISFVRSFTSNLGFLSDERRLNVILSRAKSLIIIVGNPKTLSKYHHFNTIIECCRLNKTMVGATIYEDRLNDENGLQSIKKPKGSSTRKGSKKQDNQPVKGKKTKGNSRKNIKGNVETKSDTIQSVLKVEIKSEDLENQKIKPTSAYCNIDKLFQSLPQVPSSEVDLNQKIDTTSSVSIPPPDEYSTKNNGSPIHQTESVLKPPISPITINSNNRLEGTLSFNQMNSLPKSPVSGSLPQVQTIMNQKNDTAPSILRSSTNKNNINNNSSINNHMKDVSKRPFTNAESINHNNGSQVRVKDPIQLTPVAGNFRSYLRSDHVESAKGSSVNGILNEGLASTSSYLIRSQFWSQINDSERIARENARRKSEKKTSKCIIS